MPLAYKEDKLAEQSITELEYIKDGVSPARIYQVEYLKDGTTEVLVNLPFEGTVTNLFVSYQFIRGRDNTSRLVGETVAPGLKYRQVELVSAVNTGEFRRDPRQSSSPQSSASFFQPFVEYTDGTRSEWSIFLMLGNRSYTNTRVVTLQDKVLKRIGIMSKVDNDNYAMAVSSYSLGFKFTGER